MSVCISLIDRSIHPSINQSTNQPTNQSRQGDNSTYGMKCEVPQQSFHQDFGELNARLRYSDTTGATASRHWLGRPSKAQQNGHMSIVLQARQYHIKLHLLQTHKHTHGMVNIRDIQLEKSGFKFGERIEDKLSCTRLKK